MSRSSKKGPYVDEKLSLKITKMNQMGTKQVVKTWARRSQIAPDFVGHTIAVHNGRIHIPVFITEAMVGHRLGEFAPTRTFRGHGKMTEKSSAKT
jgi:small subunit ribosomal protein S19